MKTRILDIGAYNGERWVRMPPCNIDKYLKNPVVILGFDYSRIIGKCVGLEIDLSIPAPKRCYVLFVDGYDAPVEGVILCPTLKRTTNKDGSYQDELIELSLVRL